MRGLFLFALLFPLYCTIGTVALTEHHRCIHDAVLRLVGADLTAMKFLPAEVSENFFVRITSPSESGEHKVLHFKSDLDDQWLPILIDVSTLDLDDGGRFCKKSGESIVDFFGSDIVCADNDVLTPEKKSILVEWIIPEAVKLHSERLLVEPMEAPIVVPTFSSTNLCSKFTIPQEHRAQGVPEADMVLYVAAAPTRLGTFAWGATCATLGHHGRPVVGILNYGPRYIAATPQRIRVAAHEIAHALGFSGVEMVRKQMVEWDESHLGGLPRVFLSSTNVRRAARKHYGCWILHRLELYSNDFSPSMRPIRSGLHINDTLVRKVLKSSGKIMNRKLNSIDVLPAEDEIDNPYAGNVVETYKLFWGDMGHSSHWSRRLAKDELMVGLVGAGYYTALTMGACPEGGTLTVQGESLNGEIVCPKYADVCNTIDSGIERGRGRSRESDGDVAAAILAPLLFIFLAVSTIMAP
ncbi:Peptidase M8 [Trypanosoma melophagium]|uniref:Peptidase M8 n=1 Tax=Trypanosoma melophagium TaxID=715481 RepID=UPI00351A23D0|nr:Peptidase M8 [Trypanosoma melophagium]